MSKAEQLKLEIEQIPESLLDELLDFARFLKSKAAHESAATAILSESVLAKDWLRPEVDAAWQGL